MTEGNRLRIWVRRSISVGIVLLFAVYIVLNLESFRPILSLNPIFLAAAMMFLVCNIILNGVFTKIVCDYYDKKATLGQGIFSSLLATVGNFFAPAGSGLGVKAVYLKKKTGLTYKQYLNLVLVNYLILLTLSCVVAIICLLYIGITTSLPAAWLLMWAFAVGLIAIASLLFLGFRFGNNTQDSRYAIINHLRGAVYQMRRLLEKKDVICRITAVTLLTILVGFAITVCILFALNIGVDLMNALLYSTVSSLSIFINITPGNLGVKETIMLVLKDVMGFSQSDILSIAAVERIITILVIIILWIALHKSIKGYLKRVKKRESAT